MSASDSTGIVTVRLIRSFTHRSIKHIVYHNVDLHKTVINFKQFVKTEIKSHSGLPPPMRTYDYDSMKISHQPFGAKVTAPLLKHKVKLPPPRVADKESHRGMKMRAKNEALPSYLHACSALGWDFLICNSMETADPVINKENDEELMLTDDKTLMECNVGNETELSFFNLDEYRTYQKMPTLNW